jgi:ubiquinone/menaquinone biosynthesis C-methylase UbiE/intracellular sulfur oxidation DsrE/DsrF family protein
MLHRCSLPRHATRPSPRASQRLTRSTLTATLTALAALLTTDIPTALGQQESVRPGINDSFRDVRVEEYVERFEVESREVYLHRHEIVDWLNIEPGNRIADVGAGTGLFTRLLADRVGPEGEIWAVDISEGFLEHIRRRAQVEGQNQIRTLLASDRSSELPPESVDLVFVCDTYHHFEFPHSTLASIRDGLRPGGRLVVIDFHRIPGKSRQWTLDHVRAGQAVFESEIVQAGFVKTRQATGFLEENYLVEFTKSDSPGLQPPLFPAVPDFGGVVAVDSSHPAPQPGAKLLFDLTAPAADDQPHRGLQRIARLLNLYAQAEVPASALSICVVLHGEATKASLSDSFYQERYAAAANPHLPLIRQLQTLGVEVLVCGQALNYQGFPTDKVAQEVNIVVAAMTTAIERQRSGYLLMP